MAHGDSYDDSYSAPDAGMRGQGQSHDEDDTCGEAVMAAMKAISKHCDTDGVPLQTASGMVVMAPQEEMETVRNMAPEDMTDDELLNYIEDSVWLKDWAAALCERAGLREGTNQYENCLLNYARDVVGQ